MEPPAWMPSTISHAYAFPATEGTCVRSVGPSRLQLTLLTAALTPPSSPSSLTTGSRPGLEPPGLPGAPFWGTQLRSLPRPPIFTTCSCSFPTSEMLADLTAGEMYTLETGAQGAGHTLTFSRACGLADVTTELSAWVPTRTTQLILCIGHGERDG